MNLSATEIHSRKFTVLSRHRNFTFVIRHSSFVIRHSSFVIRHFFTRAVAYSTALLLSSTLCLSQAQLKETSQKHPDAVSDSRTLSRRVLPLADSGPLLEKYYARRSQEKASALHAKNPPAQFLESQSQLRLALKETFLMPLAAEKPQATLVGTAVVDGIQVEKQLLKIREGVYSPALVWRPVKDAGTQKSPAILMLPGHGDLNWSPAVQSRCLSFAKRGYVVMLVQPFGQAERGEKANWNEGHDTQATAFLLTVGQSMLGLIMSDHRAELDYLATRPDVDAQMRCLPPK